MEQTLESKKREHRKRTPAGMPKQKLKIKGMESGYKYYFADEAQLDELQDAGYNFVTDHGELEIGEDDFVNKGSVITRKASRSDDSKLYLMRIKLKWHKENQKAKQDLIDQTEEHILNPGETRTSYTPGRNTKKSELLGSL